MASVNVLFKKGYISKAGELPILVEYTHLGSRFRFNTKTKINPQEIELYFDKDIDLFRVRSISSVKNVNKQTIRSINERLFDIQSKLNSVILEQKQKSEPLIASIIKAKFERTLYYSQVVNGPLTLTQWFDRFLESKTKSMNRGLKSYQSTRNHLATHLGKSDIFLTDLKRPFFEDFLAYLTKKNLKGSTIYKQFKNIRTMLTWIKSNDEEDEIKIPSAYKAFRTIAKFSSPVGLTIDEFKQLINLDLSSYPELERTRDLFVFGVAIGGVRHGDLVTLGGTLRQMPQTVENITYFERKTSNEHRDIPINNLAKSILMKYPEFPHVPCNQRMNKNLKRIALFLNWNRKVATPTFDAAGRIVKTDYLPLNQIMSTKLMRKTAATIDGELNIEPVVSMTRSGHRSISSYMRYRQTSRSNFEIANSKWDAISF